MKTSDFDFHLPRDQIAQEPAVPRDSARMLHVRDDELHHRIVAQLPALLQPGDLMVVNDTKVMPAQLLARRQAARIGITLDKPDALGNWYALARNARRLRAGDLLSFDGCAELEATVVRGNDNGAVILRFNLDGAPFRTALQAAGALALPPYIDRPEGNRARDVSDYQTVFAAREGAVAAPTAGLHFTAGLLQRLRDRGVGIETITLHVGAGTFLPIRSEEISTHQMHSERGEISPRAATAINAARENGGRILSVGTTTLRLLETAVQPDGRVVSFEGETAIFIKPGTPILSADLLLTNFHLPRSTLFMLVCAFAGTKRMQAAYKHAIASGYRFYSYGDATLLERAR
jgi:S-adenosylmethionine:tRNA ribosyltransferase-isomerase